MPIQEKKYKKYLSQEYEPVDESAMPYLVDIRAIKVYADSKGVAIASLSDEEKQQFMIPNPNYRKKRRHSTRHSRAGMQHKIQKLNNNGSKYDKYQIFFVSLHQRYKTDEVMMTKEEALRRFKAAKQTKKDAVAALEERMKQTYEERTGLKANYVVTL